MTAYAEYEYYTEEYGRKIIPPNDFDHFSKMASVEINKYTFNNLADVEEIPDVVKECCCEVAEKLYLFGESKGDKGLVLSSYGNDGETASYNVKGMTEEEMPNTIKRIVKKWLGNTGLMYCGVM